MADQRVSGLSHTFFRSPKTAAIRESHGLSVTDPRMAVSEICQLLQPIKKRRVVAAGCSQSIMRLNRLMMDYIFLRVSAKSPNFWTKKFSLGWHKAKIEHGKIENDSPS
jgi:hypothetical protein